MREQNILNIYIYSCTLTIADAHIYIYMYNVLSSKKHTENSVIARSQKIYMCMYVCVKKYVIYCILQSQTRTVYKGKGFAPYKI